MSGARPPAEFYERLWREAPDAENAARWSFQGELAERALAWVGADPGLVVLELGPGAGRETAALLARGARVVALDLTVAALARTRVAAGARVEPVLGLAEALPLRSGSVDRIFAQTILMHVDLRAAAAEWLRVLAPGGRVVLLEPIRGNPLVGAYRRLFSPYRVTRPQYVTVAEIAAAAAGLELVRHEEHYLLSVFCLALPAPVATILRAPLAALDRWLLRFAPLRKLAWMTLVELGR